MPAESASGRTGESGVFITVEGGDGAGKTTLTRALRDVLQSSGRRVQLTSEPGGSALGEELRRLLLYSELSLSDWEETWLFLAERASHVERVIRPALADGALVLSDRYVDSTLAYQGYGRGLDLSWLRHVNAEATQRLMPQLTLLLDVPAELGLQRARKRRSTPDRIGDADIAFHSRVNDGFRAIAESDGRRVKVLDASRDASTVRDDAVRLVTDWLAKPVGRRASHPSATPQ